MKNIDQNKDSQVKMVQTKHSLIHEVENTHVAGI